MRAVYSVVTYVLLDGLSRNLRFDLARGSSHTLPHVLSHGLLHSLPCGSPRGLSHTSPRVLSRASLIVFTKSCIWRNHPSVSDSFRSRDLNVLSTP